MGRREAVCGGAVIAINVEYTCVWQAERYGNRHQLIASNPFNRNKDWLLYVRRTDSRVYVRHSDKEVYAMTYERAIAKLADVCGEEWIRSIPAPEGL